MPQCTTLSVLRPSIQVRNPPPPFYTSKRKEVCFDLVTSKVNRFMTSCEFTPLLSRIEKEHTPNGKDEAKLFMLTSTH